MTSRGIRKHTFHLQWVNPPRLGSAKASWMKTSFFSRAKARSIIVLSLPLMRSQQPSDGLFSPMEVRTDHLPMCTDPPGTCPSGMVLHIKNFALHGLFSPRDHSNVNHISSLILSNGSIRLLAYHLIAQRYYTDLLYKAEEKTKSPVGPTSIRKGKFPKDIIQAM
jgi:hypothetical protein